MSNPSQRNFQDRRACILVISPIEHYLYLYIHINLIVFVFCHFEMVAPFYMYWAVFNLFHRKIIEYANSDIYLITCIFCFNQPTKSFQFTNV